VVEPVGPAQEPHATSHLDTVWALLRMSVVLQDVDTPGQCIVKGITHVDQATGAPSRSVAPRRRADEQGVRSERGLFYGQIYLGVHCQ
jgi:hypothetical protein